MASHRPLYHRFAWAFDLVVPDASAGRVRRMAALLRPPGVRPPARPALLPVGHAAGSRAPTAAAARGDPARVAETERQRAERVRHAVLDVGGAAAAVAARRFRAGPPDRRRATGAAG